MKPPPPATQILLPVMRGAEDMLVSGELGKDEIEGSAQKLSECKARGQPWPWLAGGWHTHVRWAQRREEATYRPRAIQRARAKEEGGSSAHVSAASLLRRLVPSTFSGRLARVWGCWAARADANREGHSRPQGRSLTAARLSGLRNFGPESRKTVVPSDRSESSPDLLQTGPKADENV